MNRRDAAQDTLFRLEGGLLPADLLNQLDALGLPGQQPSDYAIPKGALAARRDRPLLAYRPGPVGQLRRQQRQREDLADPTATAQRWMEDLLTQVFGFTDLTARRPRSGDRRAPLPRHPSRLRRHRTIGALRPWPGCPGRSACHASVMRRPPTQSHWPATGVSQRQRRSPLGAGQ
jgi:hypothetical protein